MRSGRSIAVHRAAKDAAQVPMLLYGPEGIYRSRLLFLRRKTLRRERFSGEEQDIRLSSLDRLLKRAVYGIMGVNLEYKENRMSRILIIEDDEDLREGLVFSLEMDGYETSCAGTKREGMELLKKSRYDLVLLDCNLPDGSGYDLCTEIREYGDMPLFMLTARNTEMDEVKALELGAADFMSKPFSLAVLKARIRKILQSAEQGSRLVSGGIVIDRDACRVTREGGEVPLSRIEYQLLLYLVENRNRVLAKEQILSHVWDSQGKFVDENTLSVNIRRLRTKLEEDPKHPGRIRTVHGIGYVWKEGEQ